MDTHDSTTKICSKCGTEYPSTVEFFRAEKRTKIGLNAACRVCERAYGLAQSRKPERRERQKALDKQKRATNPEYRERQNERTRKRRQNPEVRQAMRDYDNKRRQDPEYKAKARVLSRSYYWEHRDEILAKRRTPEYREKDRKRNLRPDVKAYKKEWEEKKLQDPEYKAARDSYFAEYRKRPEVKLRMKAVGKLPSTKASNKNWYQKNRHSPEFVLKQKVQKHLRRARERALPCTLTAREWQNALNYFHGCCAVCGRQLKDLLNTHTVAADHWIPLVDPKCPGTVVHNMLPLCHGIGGCNNSKHTKDPVIWLTEKLGKRAAKKKLAEIEAYFATVRK